MSRVPTFPARRGFVLAVAVVLSAARPCLAGARPADVRSEIRRILMQQDSHTGLVVEEQSSRLAALGSRAIPVLLELVQAETVAHKDDELNMSPRPADVALSPRQEEIVLATLVKFRRSDLIGPVSQALARSKSARARAGCLQVLGTVGEAFDLPLLCSAVAPADPDQDIDLHLAPAFEGACVAILERDFRAFAVVESLIRKQPSGTRMHLIRALGATRSESALLILGPRLGVEPSEDPLVLWEIGQAAATVPLPVNPSIPAAVRRYLYSAEPSELQFAIDALGKLEDAESFPSLLDLLAHENPPIREAANRALGSIAGVNLLPDERRWRAWYQEEQAWFAHDSSSWIDQLCSADPAKSGVALTQSSKHKLYRNELARAVLRVLPKADGAIRVLGCDALGQLGSCTAIPYLLECVNGPDPGLAACASQALERIRTRRAGASAAGTGEATPPASTVAAQ